ncbi:MAG TPA: hypothetical protein VJO99_08005 [Burkholderiaceae bacterium]|nr:hypothetical protein [Burkholderiaceae bacterium]
MNKQVNFKESQLYAWESEPVDERPSEFMSSTGYATLSGYHSAIGPVRRARRGSRFGLAGMLAFVLVVIAAGGWAIVKLAPLLHR